MCTLKTTCDKGVPNPRGPRVEAQVKSPSDRSIGEAESVAADDAAAPFGTPFLDLFGPKDWDPGVPPPLAGLALARALAQNPTKAERTLQTEDFQQAETANPVPPSSRTPITGVPIQRIWAEESNSRRGKPQSKRRFYLAFTLTKSSKDRASSVLGWTFFFAGFVAAAKMFCARASARLRPAPHTQYSLGGAGPNLTEVLGRVGPGPI
ncbi:hypothetical protein THAOC_23192 [Thalassiosira oceanica]|uniref:Uncharacterized protein n=1 Tax=Thalassiosira oceanica TaxID=159749 RepID=K0SDW3_THAOC|nr:hypothetical protein THAOC_23192 [Thalassiosira oceanica]|eukprot:EJK56837.1 hypothetical protein THAOC_23192 [Thalassiosira oceanica]